MPVVYRPARADDLEPADALVVASINELTERHGFGRMAESSPPKFQSFCLTDDPRGLWTAEEDGDILGFAWSWVCEDLWFLAQLFVKPGIQGRGLGNELLSRTLDHARAAGATKRALITFAFNTVSQGLYIRNGFLPRFPIYTLGVAREALCDRLGDAPLHRVALDGSDAHVQQLARIDRQALGVSRGKHHAYLTTDPTCRGYGLHAGGGDWLGYVYVSDSGHIGPLAVAVPEVAGAAFKTALVLAAETASPRISAFVPGTSVQVLGAAVQHGMRIRFPMLFMSDADIGDWSGYLPRNPGFM